MTEQPARMSRRERDRAREMIANAHRRTVDVAASNRQRNLVAEDVFYSHAGQPAEVVLAELLRQAHGPYRPTAAALWPVAQAISEGKRFAFADDRRTLSQDLKRARDAAQAIPD